VEGGSSFKGEVGPRQKKSPYSTIGHVTMFFFDSIVFICVIEHKFVVPIASTIGRVSYCPGEGGTRLLFSLGAGS
jgi:hypothetical protein